MSKVRETSLSTLSTYIDTVLTNLPRIKKEAKVGKSGTKVLAQYILTQLSNIKDLETDDLF